MEWTAEKLYDLRKEIILGSLFINDYNNSFGIDPHSCSDFFDSFADYIAELMIDDGNDPDCFFDIIDDYDNIENLWNWFNCYEDDPFIYKEVAHESF